MNKQHLLVIITDGVSLRNFAYSSFHYKALEAGYRITYWNGTPFDLASMGYDTHQLKHAKLHPLTSVTKNARKHVELNCFANRKNDSIYLSYKFPWPSNNIKNRLRSYLSQLLIMSCNSEKGLNWLRKMTFTLERKTKYYKFCIDTLNELKPDLVYNSSQRSVLAIAPIEAAKKLNISTIGFIFSWDNIPKSMLEVETDRYHVWSSYMKNELINYHPFIKPFQVYITGTPQFEPHFDQSKLLTRADFYKMHNLNPDYEYYCFSGDDITTSPKDELYLRDVAIAIQKLKTLGYKLGLIFRRCPVDLSGRYDTVLHNYSDCITIINPLWDEVGGQWNQILPRVTDGVLLANLAEHCVGVINLGSSMVFDFVSHRKPCAYLFYHYDEDNTVIEGVHVYDYVHFRSMPSQDAVLWLNHPNNIKDGLLKMLKAPEKTVKIADQWFQIINEKSTKDASSRILDAIHISANK